MKRLSAVLDMRGLPQSLRLVAQTIKNLPATGETTVQSLHQEDLLEKGMATQQPLSPGNASIISQEISCTEEPGRAESAKTKQIADCNSDHEFFIAKLKLKLKQGKPLDHSKDLNQTSYNYTVELTNRFKGVDLIDRVPEELWTEVYNMVQEVVIKTIPQKKKCKKQNGCLRRPCKQLRKEEK